MKLTLFFCSLFFSAISVAAADSTISTERQQQLLHLLKQDCGSCHGMTLKGGLGPAILPTNLKQKSDEFLFNSIYYGRPGTAMPPWKPLLKKQEIQFLVQVLKQGVANYE